MKKEKKSKKDRKPKASASDSKHPVVPRSLLGGPCGTPIVPTDRYVPPTFREKLLEAVAPHRKSFDTFAEYYTKQIIKTLDPVYVDPTGSLATVANPHYKPKKYASIRVTDVQLEVIGCLPQSIFS